MTDGVAGLSAAAHNRDAHQAMRQLVVMTCCRSSPSSAEQQRDARSGADLSADDVPCHRVVPGQETFDVLTLPPTVRARDRGLLGVAPGGLLGERAGKTGPVGEGTHAARG